MTWTIKTRLSAGAPAFQSLKISMTWTVHNSCQQVYVPALSSATRSCQLYRSSYNPLINRSIPIIMKNYRFSWSCCSSLNIRSWQPSPMSATRAAQISRLLPSRISLRWWALSLSLSLSLSPGSKEPDSRFSESFLVSKPSERERERKQKERVGD